MHQDATCVCTSTSPGRCDGLAQNILDLIPTLNQCFLTNMTPRAVYNGIWLAQGAPEGSNCTSQSLLVDVAPALNLRTLPNVTQWAQTALLWNLIESQDIRAVMKLQNFIQNAPWNMFGQSVENTSFSVLVSGYTFNFAVQQVAPPNTSFVLQSQPTKTQLAHVGSGAQSVLDRMYSFAVGKAIFSSHVIILIYLPSFVHAVPNGLAKLLDLRSSAAAGGPAGLHLSTERLPYLTSFRCHTVTPNRCKPIDSSGSFIFSTSAGMLSRAQLSSERVD